MRRQPIRRWLPALAMLLLAACWRPAAATDDGPAERQRIAAERAAAESGYTARVAECERRFAVTDCMKAAQRERRDIVDRLNRQLVVLDEAQRKQRAAQRIEAIRRKVEADEAAQRARPPSVAASAQLRLREPPSRSASRRGDPTRQSARSRQEAQRVERQLGHEKRQAEMKAHRAVVEKRNQVRAASGKPSAAPLPAGPSASAAAR